MAEQLSGISAPREPGVNNPGMFVVGDLLDHFAGKQRDPNPKTGEIVTPYLVKVYDGYDVRFIQFWDEKEFLETVPAESRAKGARVALRVKMRAVKDRVYLSAISAARA